jgi:hypothetical protein
MYTVVRFMVDPERRDDLLRIGARMNVARAGVFTGLRKAGDGFACEVCADPSWQVHAQEILRFVADFEPCIQAASQIGANVTVDVAVEPEDAGAGRLALVLGWDAALLGALAAAGVRVEVSIYASGVA